MRGAAKSFLPLEPIMADDSPLDKLRLLEQVQGGRDFLVSVVAETPEQAHTLRTIQDTLKDIHYATFLDVDTAGREVLRVHYVGKETGVVQGFQELGLLGGMRHLAEKAASPLHEGGEEVARFVKYTADDPARLLAGLWLLGDVFYTMAGNNNKEDGKITLEGRLMNFSGYMAIAQSLLYLGFARDNSEVMVEQVGNRIQHALHQGIDPFNGEVWAVNPMQKTTSPIDKVLDFIKKNPIEIGANMQIIGQLGLAASGMSSALKGDKEAWWDVSRAAASISAWSMMKLDEEHTEQKTAWREDPMARLMQEVKESPHRFAAPMSSIASGLGICASHSKRLANEAKIQAVDAVIKNQTTSVLPKFEGDEKLLKALQQTKQDLIDKRPNPMQFVAEATYLVGDGTMFFARKANYGEGGAHNTEHMAKVAAQQIARSEIVMTESTLTQFVHDLSSYLAECSIVQQRVAGMAINEAQEQEEIATMAHALSKDVFAQLAVMPHRSEQVAQVMARITELFPLAQQAEVQAQMVESLTQVVGVNIEKAEMGALVQQQLQRFKEEAIPSQARSTPPSMAEVAPLLAELTFLLPSVNAAQNASILYDAVVEATKPSPMREQFFDTALKQQAAEDLGVPLHALRAEMRDARPIGQPALVGAR